MRQIAIDDYRRISKHAARRRHDNCQPSYIVPVNFRPDNMFMPAVAVPVADPYWTDFDEFVNTFERANCQFAETGRYAAFYVHIDKDGNVLE
jgi:hypothetical protein